MLPIEIPDCEFFDEEREEFITFEGQTIRLEHSLSAIAKWESKWQKAFLVNGTKTEEETISYIECMALDPIDPIVFRFLPDDTYKKINAYIEAPMTATVFTKNSTSRPNREVITAEIIYYWMFSLGIPREYDKEHLNKLLTLIEVFNRKNSKPKKMSKTEIMRRNHELNEARKKALGTRG